MRRLTAVLCAALSSAVLLAFAACFDGSGGGPTAPMEDADSLGDRTVQASRSIVDGSLGNGDSHFHWLYPISSAPSYSGVFDPTLAPRVTVEVCELSGETCAGSPIATFTSTAANYWEQIRVSTRRQYYLVYWSSAGADPASHYRVRVLLDGTRELGHADIDVVPTSADLGAVDANEYVGLVRGSWLSIVFRLEEGVDAVNTAPSVEIVTPAEGAEVGPGPVSLAGTATDAEDGDLSESISWSSDVDGALGSGAALQSPLSPGPHTLTAEVTDAGGLSGSASTTVTVRENQSPVVSISSPVDGETIIRGQDLVLSATASDPDDDSDLSPDVVWTSEPDIGGLVSGPDVTLQPEAGTYRLTATVTDPLGAEGSASVTVTVVPDEEPVVTIVEPDDGITVPEGTTVTFSGTAADAEDGDLTGSLTWSSDLDGPLGSGGSVGASLSVGTHTVTASATDGGGGTGSATVRVDVASNTPPVVSITDPADGAVFQSDDVTSFTATASDQQDGDLTASIEWTSDRDGPLGSGGSIQPDLSGGGHRITAAVTDALGATTTVGIDILVGIVGVQQTLAVPFSATASLPITLAEPAPPAGLTLTVTSADPSIVEVLTPTVQVAPGTLAANALVEGIAPGNVTLTVTTPNLGSGTSEATVTGELGIDPANLVFTGGFGPGVLQVGLFSSGNPAVAPPGGLEVKLAADEPACVSVPPTATVPQGQGGVDVEVAWASATLPCSTTVRVSAPNLDPASADVQLRAPPVFEISSSVAQRLSDGVGAGLMTSVQARLSVPDHGGTTVVVTTSDATRLLLSRTRGEEGQASVAIPVRDTETGFSFWIHGVDGNVGDAELEFTASGVPSRVFPARVVTPSVRLTGVPEKRQVFGSDTKPSFETGVVVEGAFRVQGPRYGTVVTATLTSSDSTLAAFDLGEEVFSDRVEVESTGFFGDFPRYESGVLQANNVGVVTVGVEVPGFLPHQAEQEMTIIGSDIILTSGGNVGNGLMTSLRGTLSERPPEDTPVTIVANHPDRVLVSFGTTSPDDSPVARDSIQTGPLNRNGFLRFTFWVHVLEDATEPGTITVSAPGYNPTTVTITPDPNLEYLVGLFGKTGGGSMSRTVQTLDQSLSYSASLRLQNGSSLGGQVVRSDHPNPPTLQITSSDLTVGGFLPTGSTELVDTHLLRFIPGRTQAGVAFRPDQPGTTTVSVTNPTGDLVPRGSTSGVVTVVGTPLIASDQTVGRNLMTRARFYLGEYAPETLTATVTSSDVSVVKVGSAGFSNPGESAQDVVTTGNNRIEVSLHGMSNGTAELTIEAPGYETTRVQVTVVDPAVRILRGLPGTVRTFDNPDPFSFWVGHTAGSSFTAQHVRTGFGPLPVTVTSSDSDVGLLQAASAPEGSATSSIVVELPEGAYVIGEGNPAAPAFVPVVNGTTQITLSAPDFGGTSRSVTVVSPQINVAAQTRVGGGLYRFNNTVVMGSPYGSPNHGGVTLRLESSDPSRLLLGPKDGTDPAGTYEVVLPDGVTRIDFSAHGVQGTTAANVQIRATAQGFVDGTDFVDVVTPRFRVSGLGSSLGVGASDAFDLRFETASYEYGWVSDPAGLPVTLTSSDPGVVAVSAGTGTSGSVTSVVPRGDYWLLSTLSIVGVAPGTATITVSAPGFEPYTRTITVNSP